MIFAACFDRLFHSRFENVTYCCKFNISALSIHGLDGGTRAASAATNQANANGVGAKHVDAAQLQVPDLASERLKCFRVA